MNVIVVSKKGIIEEVICIEHNHTADAEYEKIIRELLGDDFEDIVGFFDDDVYDMANEYLNSMGIDVSYFTGLEVNKFKN